MNKRSFFLLFLAVGFLAIPLARAEYEAPALTSEESWTMVLLPDPQTYQKFGRNQPIFELMTAWVAENIDRLNIELVLCTGDLVDQNSMLDPLRDGNGRFVNQTSKAQWEAVANSFGRLDGRVPYITATGNHDYGYRNAEVRRSHFNDYFPIDKNWRTQALVRAVGLNAEGNPTLENAAYEFTSPHGKKFLVLSLEFAPRDAALEWGKSIVAKKEFQDHTVILLTHSYLNGANERIESENYPLKDVNYGAAIWEKLVKPSTNIRMVFSGHIAAPDQPLRHLGFRVDPNAAGEPVNQMAFNAQALGGGWHGNGGDGWLRLLEFMPDGKTVKVKTFSPFFAISPTTQPFAWRREPHDQFEFYLE